MTTWDVRTEIRSLGRQVITTGLQMVPARAFEPLRLAFPSLPESSIRHKAARQALELVRHRGLPTDMQSFVLTDNPDVAIVSGDSFIVERLYWFGEKKGYEPEVLHWWRHYCRKADRILELGANIGYFVVQGATANPSARYIAVEPYPGGAEMLRRNLVANRIANVEVVEAAAVPDGHVGKVQLLLPGGRDHYKDAPCTGFLASNEAPREETRSLSSLWVSAVGIGELTHDVKLIKLDIEGQEHGLLSAIFDYLVTSRPTIFVELLDDTPKLRSLIVELCTSTSYRCYIPQRDRLVPLATDRVTSISVEREYATRDIIITQDAP